MRVGVVDESRTRALRRAVLRPNLGPDEPLPGDDLTAGVHLAATAEDGTVLGTCLVYPDPCPWLPDVDNPWHLRQMATAEGHRRKGVGAAVLAAAVDYVQRAGASVLWCNARESAGSFYARHGFRFRTCTCGENFPAVPPRHEVQGVGRCMTRRVFAHSCKRTVRRCCMLRAC
jgi:GNAT superfamily N-acetyltransferase